MALGASGNVWCQSGNVCFELRTVAVVTECRDRQFPRTAVPIQVPGVGAHISSWLLIARLSQRRRGSRVEPLSLSLGGVVAAARPQPHLGGVGIRDIGLDKARPRTPKARAGR